MMKFVSLLVFFLLLTGLFADDKLNQEFSRLVQMGTANIEDFKNKDIYYKKISDLIKSGADVNYQVKNNLYDIISKKDYKLLKILIDNGLNLKDKNVINMFYSTLNEAQKQFAILFIDAGIDINNNEILFQAIYESHKRRPPSRELVASLLNKGVTVEDKFRDAKTNESILVRAYYTQDHGIIKLISDKIKNKYINNIDSDLITAIVSGDIDMSENLLKKKKEIDCELNPLQQTPLMKACQAGNFKMVNNLLDKNASVNKFDKRARSPLIFAAGAGDIESLKLLISKGASINQHLKDVNKKACWTPLSFAAYMNKPDAVTFLVQKGANCSIINSHGLTALNYAELNCMDDEILKLLKVSEPKKDEKEAVPQK